MVKKSDQRLERQDWIRGALELLETAGIDGIRIVPLAKRLGVTSGSFYWHFKNRRELHNALAEYWEREMTDAAIEASRPIEPPEKRIWFLMERVMESGLASMDLPFWHWARSDSVANEAFKRVLKKRFIYAAWMFRQAGFTKSQAEIRGRMMVVYMMGESTLVSDTLERRKKDLKQKYEILLNPL